MGRLGKTASHRSMMMKWIVLFLALAVADAKLNKEFMSDWLKSIGYAKVGNKLAAKSMEKVVAYQVEHEVHDNLHHNKMPMVTPLVAPPKAATRKHAGPVVGKVQSFALSVNDAKAGVKKIAPTIAKKAEVAPPLPAKVAVAAAKAAVSKSALPAAAAAPSKAAAMAAKIVKAASKPASVKRPEVKAPSKAALSEFHRKSDSMLDALAIDL